MSDQDSLTIFGKKHQVSFPVARLAPFVDVGRAPIDAHAPLDAIDHLATSASTPTALALAPGKIVAPTIVLSTAILGFDKTINRLITDDCPSLFLFQSSGDLSGRPTLSQAFEYLSLEVGLRSNRLPRQRRLLACCSAYAGDNRLEC